MTDREIKNAKITGTTLGYEDHGILTCFISLSYGGSSQSFGGYALDSPQRKDGKPSGRIGTAYGMEFIRRILEVVGVSKWEDLVGEHVRADCEWTKVHGIGHITEKKWFFPEKDLAHILIGR